MQSNHHTTSLAYVPPGLIKAKVRLRINTERERHWRETWNRRWHRHNGLYYPIETVMPRRP